MNRADADDDDLVDLPVVQSFDMVDGRSRRTRRCQQRQRQWSHGLNNGGNASLVVSTVSRGLNGFGGIVCNNATGRAMAGGNGINGNMNNQQLFNNTQDKALLNNLSGGRNPATRKELAQQGNLNAEAQADLLERRDATIYSTIRRNNQIIVRTGDNRSWIRLPS